MLQIQFLVEDLKRIIGEKKYRWLFVWISRQFVGIFIYRLERSLYLLLGNVYPVLRILFLPILNVLQAYSNIEIHYKSDIKGGILILHPSMGVVISAYARIGKNLTLTGGNVLGVSKHKNNGSYCIGDSCELGANATIIGPVQLGSHIKIGANACVVKSFKSDRLTLVGVPSKPLK